MDSQHASTNANAGKTADAGGKADTKVNAGGKANAGDTKAGGAWSSSRQLRLLILIIAIAVILATGIGAGIAYLYAWPPFFTNGASDAGDTQRPPSTLPAMTITTLSTTPSVPSSMAARLDALERALNKITRTMPAMAGQVAEIGSRINGIENTFAALSATASPNVLLLAAAEMHLTEVEKELTRGGGLRFALSSMRAAAILIKQSDLPHLRSSLTQLERVIASLEDDAHINHALKQTTALLAWLDNLLQAADAKRAASKTPVPVDSPDSMWRAWLRKIGDTFDDIVKVERADQTLIASAEFIAVRHTLLLAQNALLDYDIATWRLAMRHARDAAKQTTSPALREKLRGIKIKQGLDREKKVQAIKRIVKTIRSVMKTSDG